MKPMTREWVAKAEGDFVMVERESRARKSPNYDGLCFHAQQCIEKYLKATLSEAAIPFPKVHDLVSLLELALPTTPAWECLREDLALLTDFAVSYRYPGESADRESAMDARRRCRAVRQALRQSLGLTS